MSLSAASQNLRHTPFHDIHAALGAKLVPFAGYEMPVQYPAGITAEHKAVRTACGLFDVSHMGEFLVRGTDAVNMRSPSQRAQPEGLAKVRNIAGTFQQIKPGQRPIAPSISAMVANFSLGLPLRARSVSAASIRCQSRKVTGSTPRA